MAKLRPRLVLLIAVGLLGAAPSHTNSQITVFAAASLTDAFRAVELTLRQENPGFEIRFNFAGSQQLVAQMEQGARADVFASADERWMNYARDHSLVEGEPVIFVHNRLVVIIPRTNPARIARLQDMMKKGVKLVLAAQAVPAGKYSRDMLQNLSRSDGFSTDYATRVLANVVSNEETVKGVVAKVQLGEADAGMVYRSDVTPDVSRFVTVLEIPDAHNVIASYPIAVVRCSASLEAARAFINFVLSPEGQGILRKNGFLPIASGL